MLLFSKLSSDYSSSTTRSCASVSAASKISTGYPLSLIAATKPRWRAAHSFPRNSKRLHGVFCHLVAVTGSISRSLQVRGKTPATREAPSGASLFGRTYEELGVKYSPTVFLKSQY
jgi:hypothetical protein